MAPCHRFMVKFFKQDPWYPATDSGWKKKRSIEEIATEDRRSMYRLNTISHVAHNVHNERDRCIISVRRQIAMDLHPRVVPFVQRAGLLPVARLTDRWFKV
ncbi:hypothetical protein PIB30_075320 [Stylosanthes scabra]|uniref:Uncharacterized protein n=1 Tax=Stylosanthes scabra TaxID=79078 RepID=A0ABU6YNR1_9FABA|nr:hypothetical protein [Stylosanthes scabra]